MNAIDRYRDVGLLILRVGFGLSYIYFHGSYKLAGGLEFWADNGEAMANIGITFGYPVWGLLNALAETLGALMIALGLFFRPVAAILTFNMGMATLAHLVSGQGNPAGPVKGTLVFMGLIFAGPGRYSLDAWLARSKREGRRTQDTGQKTPSPESGIREKTGDRIQKGYPVSRSQ